MQVERASQIPSSLILCVFPRDCKDLCQSQEDVDSSAEEAPTENKRAIITKVQSFSMWFVTNYYVGNIMAGVVLVDAVCTWVDIDARAAGLSYPPRFFMVFSDISLALYSTEVLLLLIEKAFAVCSLIGWRFSM